MDRTAGKETGYHAMPHCSIRKQSGGTLIAMLGTACIVLFASEANAQCTARDVLQNHLTRKTTPSAKTPPSPVESAFAVPVWRTITVGTFANSFALLYALDAAGCSIGSSAEEILARPAFTVGTRKTNVELFAVSAAELGFQTDTAPLADIYARARSRPGQALSRYRTAGRVLRPISRSLCRRGFQLLSIGIRSGMSTPVQSRRFASPLTTSGLPSTADITH